MNANLLKEYFEKTSREQVLKDWEETKKYDKVGISIETYWKETDKALYKTLPNVRKSNKPKFIKPKNKRR